MTRLLPLLGFLLLTGCNRGTVVGAGAHAMIAGSVVKTNNPQVALYSIAPPSPSEVKIEFGTDEHYGLSTWTRHAEGKVPVRILVAGMRPATSYHMRATIRFADGTVVRDIDHVFQTGALSPRMADWHIQSKQLRPGLKPGAIQPGLELLSSITGLKSQVVLADLQGRILWTYEMPEWQTVEQVISLRSRERNLGEAASLFGWKLHSGPLHDPIADTAQREAHTTEMLKIASSAQVAVINPVKFLPNGDFLILFALASQSLLSGPSPNGSFAILREIDLAGDTVRQITIAQLNRKLQRAGHRELRLQTFHHDVEVLPNGHWIVIANVFRPGSDPGQGQTDLFGDVLVELDNHLNPVWTWNTFDHLDIHRRPMWSPDWTHSNAVVYTPEDGNLLLSMRHQNWIIKIDYRNGGGTGKILWRLGQGGDLKLLDGKDPEDWPYGQHLPAILGPGSAGVFRLALMDNGEGRVTGDGAHCAEPNTPGTNNLSGIAAGYALNPQIGERKGPECYSAIPVFEIDENAKTARLIRRKVFAPDQYSVWGGGTDALPNGDIEATLSSQGNHGKPGINSAVLELDPELEEIWQMDVIGTPVYRAQRIPSLYPGVLFDDEFATARIDVRQIVDRH